MTKVRPEKIFLTIALFFGLIFIFLNPPFMAPDEDCHFAKIYGFSEKTLHFKIKDKKKGFILPNSIIKMFDEYRPMTYFKERKTTFSKIEEFVKLDLEKNNNSFYNIPVTFYNILAYLPSLFALIVAKFLNLKPLFLMYLLRFVNLLVYLSLTYFAIKLMPFKKWMLCAVAVLPMSIYMGSSINTDPLLNGLAFYFIAFTLNLAFNDQIEKISKKQLIIFTILAFWITSIKFPYAFLTLIGFMIPKEKFHIITKTKFFFCFCLATFLLVFFKSIYEMKINSLVPLPFYQYAREDLIIFILQNPFNFIMMLCLTLYKLFFYYIETMIGCFGWLHFSLPIIYIYIYIILILFISFFTNIKTKSISLKYKIFVVFLLLGFYIITQCINFLIFQTPKIIHGFQGRYILPFLPILLLVFQNNRLVFEKVPFGFIVSFVSFVGLCVSCLTILANFYIL